MLWSDLYAIRDLRTTHGRTHRSAIRMALQREGRVQCGQCSRPTPSCVSIPHRTSFLLGRTSSSRRTPDLRPRAATHIGLIGQLETQTSQGALPHPQSTALPSMRWTDFFFQSTPNFVGVIPSGDSFNITSTPTTDSEGTTGFNWTVPVKAGTDLLLVSGDQRATGAGGYVDYKVASPSDPTNTACFSFMPSATAGTPAGGNLPTASSTSVPDISDR